MSAPASTLDGPDEVTTHAVDDAAGQEPAAPKGALTALAHGRGLVGTVVVGTIVLLALFAPWLAPYGANEQIPGANLLGPSADHWLGTDAVNRDVLSRMLHGTRTSLIVVFGAVPIGAAIGSLIGLASALWNAADVVLQRVLDLILAFPAIILGIALTMLVGPGLWTVAIVVIVAEVPAFGRLTRTSVLTVRELPYVEAARVAGAGRWWQLRRHVFPNSLEPLIVQLALAMSVAVFIEGAMSFLGMGVTPPTPSLGTLIKDGTEVMYYSPSMVAGPLVVVAVLVLGLLLIAQALSAHSRRS